jgi:hypothetical protein
MGKEWFARAQIALNESSSTAGDLRLHGSATIHCKYCDWSWFLTLVRIVNWFRRSYLCVPPLSVAEGRPHAFLSR